MMIIASICADSAAAAYSNSGRSVTTYDDILPYFLSYSLPFFLTFSLACFFSYVYILPLSLLHSLSDTFYTSDSYPRGTCTLLLFNSMSLYFSVSDSVRSHLIQFPFFAPSSPHFHLYFSLLLSYLILAFQAMSEQGAGGAYEISSRMTALIGWAATTDFTEQWVRTTTMRMHYMAFHCLASFFSFFSLYNSPSSPSSAFLSRSNNSSHICTSYYSIQGV